jgi:hypothetical protein
MLWKQRWLRAFAIGFVPSIVLTLVFVSGRLDEALERIRRQPGEVENNEGFTRTNEDDREADFCLANRLTGPFRQFPTFQVGVSSSEQQRRGYTGIARK